MKRDADVNPRTAAMLALLAVEQVRKTRVIEAPMSGNFM